MRGGAASHVEYILFIESVTRLSRSLVPNSALRTQSIQRSSKCLEGAQYGLKSRALRRIMLP